MIAGYVTFDELLLLTGFTENYLKKLLLNGLKYHEIHLKYNDMTTKPPLRQCLFDLNEVEEWIKVHVF